MVLTDQQRRTETNFYLAQVQTLNEIIVVGKEANITQLEQDQQALHQEINQLSGQLEQLTQQRARNGLNAY